MIRTRANPKFPIFEECFIRVHSKCPNRRVYAYIDRHDDKEYTDYLLTEMLARNNVRVKFLKKEYQHPDAPHLRLVYISFKKKYEHIVVMELHDLRNRIAIMFPEELESITYSLNVIKAKNITKRVYG